MTEDININSNSPSDYKILIVDDVISNTMLLKALLKPEGYQLVTASDGLQAIDMTKKEMPDLILLDVMMPGMNGFEVAQHLKAESEYCEIPIIFLTALNTADDLVKGFQSGASDFVSKPFNKNELKTRINHQLALISAKRTILKQQDELRSTIAGRDKLYSVIAHELRGPIGSIKMVLNMLLANIDADKVGHDIYETLKLANQTTEEVFTLLDNLLKWTKSHIGRLNVVHQKFDLVSIISDGLDIFKTGASVKDITITLNAPDHLQVYADVDMVKTIIRNLLSNAIKFSHNSSSIIVTIKEDGNFAIVSVQDSGCGIKQDDKQKLLNAATHFSTFGTNNEEGSGLGLLLCQDFAHKINGKLWFESTEGVGSTFSFSIPQYDMSAN